MIDRQTELKRIAAERAVQFIQSGMKIGLGTGSTADLAIHALGARLKTEGLHIICVSTSNHSEDLARSLGIPTATLDDQPQLDLTIDGADEIRLDNFQIIKGRGGALLREKIVAAASTTEIIIVDESKVVTELGAKFPVPVEVIPFGWRSTRRALENLGATTVLRPISPDSSDPFITDQGNIIIDCRFGSVLPDPATLADNIKRLVGVVEHGLFINLAHRVVIAAADGVRVVEKP